MTTRVKICGITGSDDLHTAARLGADFIGMIVEIAGSPRSLSAAQAREISRQCSLPTVLLMEKTLEEIAAVAADIRPHAVQLIGDYAPDALAAAIPRAACAVWKTVRVPRSIRGGHEEILQEVAALQQAGVEAIVLDTLVQGQKGGTGKTCDWNVAALLVQQTGVPVFLAGGLGPENVERAVSAVRPYGVDVSSGVESAPGRKDPAKLRSFISRAKAA